MLMRKFDKKSKNIVLRISIATGLVLALSTVIVAFILRVKIPMEPSHVFLLSVFIMIMPPSAVEFLDLKWRKAVNKNLGPFVAEVEDGLRRGLTIVKAVELASERDFGPLTSELKKLKAMLSWGFTFEEAISHVTKKVDTPLAKRVFSLFSEANRMGGAVTRTITIMREHIVELEALERERKVAIRPQVLAVYFAFGAFLLIALLLYEGFFVELSKVGAEAGAGGLFVIVLDLAKVRELFFQLCIVEALFGGMAAGKFSEGSFGAGFKHVLILLAVALFTFTVFF